MIRAVFSESLWPLLIGQATLCMAAGLTASYLLRRRAARAHQTLLIALLASVLTPGVFVAVRHFRLGVFPPQPIPISWETAEPVISFDAIVTDLPSTDVGYEPAPVVVEQEEAATMPLPWDNICLACWSSLSAVLLARLAVQFALGLRLLTAAHTAESERFYQAIESARTRLGIGGPIRIRCSERIRSPIIWCWTRRPVLLVHPPAADEQKNIDWAGIFCHELAHLKRRDHLSGLFVEMLTALLPWHLLLWWARARLTRLSEQACDDWVLASGHDGVEYAETLLGLAAQRQMAFVPTVIGKEKTMKTRIHRIIKDRCGDPRIGTRWAAIVSVLAISAVVSVGFAQRQPAQADQIEPRQSPEAAVQRGPEEPQEAMPDWQREILGRKLYAITEQIKGQEAMIRAMGDVPTPEKQAQEFELDLLRETARQIERRLGTRRSDEDRQQKVNELMNRARACWKQRQYEAAIEQLDALLRIDPLNDQAQTMKDREWLRTCMAEGPRADMPRAPGADRSRTETRVYALQYGNAARIRAVLETLIPPQETVTIFANDAKVAVSATVENHLGIERIIRIIDVPEDEQAPDLTQGGRAEELRAITLKHFDLKRMQNLLQAMLGRWGNVSIDERTKTLIVHTSQANMRRVDSIVRELDVPPKDRASEMNPYGGAAEPRRVPAPTARPRTDDESKPEIESQVEDLRDQMRQLQELMQQMQRRLEQVTEREREGRTETKTSETQEFTEY